MTTGVELQERPAGFADAERRLLLNTPGIGPAVVERLEAVGITTLAQLQRLGGHEAAQRVCSHLGVPGWANRGNALQRALARLPVGPG